jgi:hypothetical protein
MQQPLDTLPLCATWLQGPRKLLAILQRVGELALLPQEQVAAAAGDPLLGAPAVPHLLRQWGGLPGAKSILADMFVRGALGLGGWGQGPGLRQWW